jgi:hypothetical protein
VFDSGIQDEARDRLLAGTLGWGQCHGARLECRIEYGTARDFFPIVIFVVHPEDRDRIGVVFARGPPRELNGRDGLQQREQRPTKCPGLLARDDGDGARIGECGGRFTRR